MPTRKGSYHFRARLPFPHHPSSGEPNVYVHYGEITMNDYPSGFSEVITTV